MSSLNLDHQSTACVPRAISGATRHDFGAVCATPPGGERVGLALAEALARFSATLPKLVSEIVQIAHGRIHRAICTTAGRTASAMHTTPTAKSANAQTIATAADRPVQAVMNAEIMEAPSP